MSMSGPSSRLVWGSYVNGPLEQGDDGFEYRSRHGFVSTFLFVMLFSVG